MSPSCCRAATRGYNNSRSCKARRLCSSHSRATGLHSRSGDSPMTALTDPMFHDDDAARTHFESVLWPDGPVCPHCKATEGLTRLAGKSHRPGLFQCNACRGHFTVMNGSIMERSHVPLRKWALAFHIMASSKKGMSAHQLHRMLEVNYRTAWFMEHRIRECMAGTADTTPMGGEGVIVEIDETFIGKKKDMPVRRG